ncbi:MAG: glucose-6-phosphate dehydrogenase, partial [Candidatus Bathyarchaeota archaeon]|nr:glucose-6-phosphate dehydrogenase [Candidatus Bathyarchaeota archaeon]
LFVRYDEVEGSWQLYDLLLEKDIPVHPYTAGTWGPSQATRLLSHNESRRLDRN